MHAAFTLLEALITVAIIGIIAALALPNMLPEVQRATLDGAAENVASFVARARSEAMTAKRCVRVWVPSGALHEIVAERLNTFDCDATPATLPGGIGIDGTATVWEEFTRLRLDSKRLTVAFTQAPDSSRAADLAPGSVVGTPTGFTGDEIRFRPNGRVFSDDATVLTNDDAILIVGHLSLPAAADTKQVLVDGNGLICTLTRGASPPVDGAAPNFKCP
jgi:prepilin-type N-terminal cleavage/methylation domain-containing protein